MPGESHDREVQWATVPRITESQTELGDRVRTHVLSGKNEHSNTFTLYSSLTKTQNQTQFQFMELIQTQEHPQFILSQRCSTINTLTSFITKYWKKLCFCGTFIPARLTSQNLTQFPLHTQMKSRSMLGPPGPHRKAITQFRDLDCNTLWMN